MFCWIYHNDNKTLLPCISDSTEMVWVIMYIYNTRGIDKYLDIRKIYYSSYIK